MTKYFDENIKRQQQQPSNLNSGNVIINTEDYEGDPVREWICPYCNYILYARKSRGEVDYHHCKVTIDLGAGKAQERQAIEDPNKSRVVDTETYAATTPGVEYFTEQIRIKKPTELKGSFAAMAKRGIKITNYVERGGDGHIL
jgi:hypothetical protein